MRVLTVFANPGSGSFCHTVLDRFDVGIRAAGHTHEIVDLYAMPVNKGKRGIRDAYSSYTFPVSVSDLD